MKKGNVISASGTIVIKDCNCGIIIKEFKNAPLNEPKERMERAKENYCKFRKLNPDYFVIEYK